VIPPIDLLRKHSRAEIEQYSRNASQVVPGPWSSGHYLCRVLGQYKLLVDRRDTSLAHCLMMDGFWEIWISMAIARFVQPGWRVADVGANWGYYTALMAEAVGAQGVVHAFEPNAAIANVLRVTIPMNGWGQVQLHEKGVGKEPGELVLWQPDDYFGSAYLLPKGADPPSSQYEMQNKGFVEVNTLDELVKEPLDFVKIDAEGLEPAIWEGMKRHRQNPNLRIAMEFSPAAYENPRKFLQDIVADGFLLRRIDVTSELAPVTPEELLEVSMEMLWLSRNPKG